MENHTTHEDVELAPGEKVVDSFEVENADGTISTATLVEKAPPQEDTEIMYTDVRGSNEAELRREVSAMSYMVSVLWATLPTRPTFDGKALDFVAARELALKMLDEQEGS